MGANARRKGFDSDVLLFGAIRTEMQKRVVTPGRSHDMGTRTNTLMYDIGQSDTKAVAALHSSRWRYEPKSTDAAAPTAGM